MTLNMNNYKGYEKKPYCNSYVLSSLRTYALSSLEIIFSVRFYELCWGGGGASKALHFSKLVASTNIGHAFIGIKHLRASDDVPESIIYAFLPTSAVSFNLA